VVCPPAKRLRIHRSTTSSHSMQLTDRSFVYGYEPEGRVFESPRAHHKNKRSKCLRRSVEELATLDATGVATASVVGHDFGANIAWNAAMMRPDRFTAVCGMSVQFRQPGGPSFLDKLRAAGKNQFYWFDMMRADSDQAWANAVVSVPGMMYWTSGEPRKHADGIPSIHHAACCALLPWFRE
jgi:pimeloyl-ACP methyl ester carboxylesterase